MRYVLIYGISHRKQKVVSYVKFILRLASGQKYLRGAQSRTNQDISTLDLHGTIVLEAVFILTEPYLSRLKRTIDFDDFTGPC